MLTLYALLTGCVLDILFGDPVGIPHIIVGIGKLIDLLERLIRSVLPKTPGGELWGGGILAFLTLAVSVLPVWAALYFLGLVHPLARLILEALICWQCLAARCLADAGNKVYKELIKPDLDAARREVGYIVGRDTSRLDEKGISRATVETIAENTSDGVIAPLIFMAIGGGVLGVMYKAVNTMDSMVGYKNERYLYFGRAAAKLDDVFNFIPSRISALLMIPASLIVRLDAKGALRIFLRDRNNHLSPNSAQTESAVAGALGVQLGGSNIYFGKQVQKPTIGDALRPIEPADILRASRLMYCTSALGLLLCTLIRGSIYLWL
jgi:adenosylcobinamide-phosphate synthase